MGKGCHLDRDRENQTDSDQASSTLGFSLSGSGSVLAESGAPRWNEEQAQTGS